jgi:Tfp pilus assembly protein PilN
MVYAISKQLVKSYVALADAAHLNLVGLEYGGNAQFQVLTRKVQPANTATTYIDINESNSVVSILKDGKLELQRTISYGTNQIINRIRDYKSYSNLNTSQLFDLVRNEQFVRERFDEDDLSMMNMDENMSDEASVAAFEKLDIKDGIIDDLRAFINSVSRQVDSYRSKNRNVQINPNTFVLGKGSLVKGMLELLSNELGTKTEMLTNIPGLDFPKKYNNDVVVQMYTVVGAGIAPIEFEILREENVKKKESENLTVYYLATLVALVISIALIGIGLIRMQTAKSENKKKKEKIEALTNELGDIYDKWEASKAAVVNIQTFDYSTYAYSSELKNFVNSLEETIPADAVIGSLTMSGNIITMSVTTESEETAAQFIQYVRDMELVKSVENSGIAISTNEETVPATTPGRT